MYFLLLTTSGFVGYWDGDMLAGKGLSFDVPRSKGLTFGTSDEAFLWAERINAATGAAVDVVNRDGILIERSESDGLLSGEAGSAGLAIVSSLAAIFVLLTVVLPLLVSGLATARAAGGAL